MNIAFVTTESPYDNPAGCGIAAYLRAIIPAIVSAGHRVTVFANAKEEKNFIAEDGRVSVYQFRLPSLHWYSAKIPLVRGLAPLPLRQLEWSAAFYRHVARVAAKTNIDVIESTETGSLFLDRIAPLVIRLHGSELTFRKYSGIPLNLSVKWNEALENYTCRRASAITAPSQFQADEIVHRRRWPKARVRVIPNPISGSLIKAAQSFHRNGISERIVLYTGRLARVKGIDTLLAAARLVHEADSSVRFVLAGPWQMPESPDTYGLKLNQESSHGIHWVGPRDQRELIEWYKRAALFVMPSHYESFGISAIEAMMFGAPVIATDTSGLTETVGNDGLGSLVPKGDSQVLAARIIDLMSSKNGHRANSEGYRSICERFHPERIAAEMIRVYEAVHRVSHN